MGRRNRLFRLQSARGFEYLAYLLKRLRERRSSLHHGRSRYYAELWRDAADQLNAEFSALSEGFCEVRLGDRTTRMWQQYVMLDDQVTLLLAGNKVISNRILERHGLPVPPFLSFRLPDLEPALDFLRAQGEACVVKPVAGTGGGKGITANVRTERDLLRAAAHASVYGSPIMIERQIAGDSYRLLYLDGELIDAIRRRTPTVTGDGRSSVRRLIEAENRRRVAASGEAVMNLIATNPDCRATLAAAGLSLSSVPAAGARVVVNQVSNHNAEADNVAVLAEIGPGLAADGARAAQALGVRLAGVDVMTTDPGSPLELSGGVVLEVNTTPGLHFHTEVANPEQSVPVGLVILRRLLGLEPEARALEPGMRHAR